MGLGPIINWRENTFRNSILKILPSIILSFLLFFILIVFYNFSFSALLGYTFAGWIFANVAILVLSNTSIRKIFIEYKFLSSNQTAVSLAHLGIAVFAIGAISDSFFSKEVTLRSYPG